MTHDDDDDELYSITRKKFDDVTELKRPERQPGADYYRLYDAEAQTLIYSDGETMAIRDGSGFDT